jgi:hypothetical protein
MMMMMMMGDDDPQEMSVFNSSRAGFEQETPLPMQTMSISSFCLRLLVQGVVCSKGKK